MTANRVGKVKEKIEDMEPVIRNSNLFSFDIAAIQHALISFFKVSISYLGLWVLLPVKLRDDDNEATKKYKRVSNIATFIFYSAFLVTIILALLINTKSNIDYKNFKNEYESQQRK